MAVSSSNPSSASVASDSALKRAVVAFDAWFTRLAEARTRKAVYGPLLHLTDDALRAKGMTRDEMIKQMVGNMK